MNIKLNFMTASLQSFVGKRVEIQDNSSLDGTRGILKSYVMERNSIVGVIQVRTLMDRLFGREGELVVAPIESLVDLVTSTPLDIYSTDMVETECECDEDGDEVDVAAYKWDTVRRKPTNMSEEEMEEMYGEFYEGCPCNGCLHSGTIDSVGDNSPCLKCVVADHCADVQSLCLDCKYHGLTYPKED
jgi:hypothetical protein